MSYHGNPVSFNPLFITSVDDGLVSHFITLPLMERDEDTLLYKPALAEKVSVSKDQKTFHYYLDPKAKWADGSSVTLDDVEFTWNTIQDPKTPSSLLRLNLAGIVFKKINEHEFEFQVEQPRFNTMTRLHGFMPIQKKQFEHEKMEVSLKGNLYFIGNGPYRLKAFQRDQSFVIEKVANWWAKELSQNKGRFAADSIEYKVSHDSLLDYERWMKGELDILELEDDQYSLQVKGTDKEKIGDHENSGKPVWAGAFPSNSPSGFWGLALNLKDPILKGKFTRQALAYLIDYDAMLEKNTPAESAQAVSPFGRNSDYTDPSLRGKREYHFDPKKAAQLLKKDGWEHQPGQSFWSKKINGKPTELKIAIKFSFGGKKLQMLAEKLKKEGVELELEKLEKNVLWNDFDTAHYQVLYKGIGGNLEPDPRKFWHSDSIKNGANTMGYSNPEVDRLTDQAKLELDVKKRQKLIQKITRILYDDVPFIFIVDRSRMIYGINSKIKTEKWVRKYGGELATDLFHW